MFCSVKLPRTGRSPKLTQDSWVRIQKLHIFSCSSELPKWPGSAESELGVSGKWLSHEMSS